MHRENREYRRGERCYKDILWIGISQKVREQMVNKREQEREYWEDGIRGVCVSSSIAHMRYYKL
jgi:hypothetical protein